MHFENDFNAAPKTGRKKPMAITLTSPAAIWGAENARLSSSWNLGFVTKESSFRNVRTFPEVGMFRRKITP